MSFADDCSKSPFMSLICIFLIAIVIQNCIMDIGIGSVTKCLGMEGFTDFSSNGPQVGGSDVMPGVAAAPSKLAELEQHQSVENLSRTPSTCYPQPSLEPADLLPEQNKKAVQEFNIAQPIGEGILADVNLLDAGSHIGVNTVGQSMRNSNLQIRSEPPNPQVNVSPWGNTTIGPDLPRRPLEVGESCSA